MTLTADAAGIVIPSCKPPGSYECEPPAVPIRTKSSRNSKILFGFGGCSRQTLLSRDVRPLPIADVQLPWW